MGFDNKKWAFLTKKYPERAGVAYELYLRDPKKQANPTTYFMWAGKKIYSREKAYQENLRKYQNKNTGEKGND